MRCTSNLKSLLTGALLLCALIFAPLGSAGGNLSPAPVVIANVNVSDTNISPYQLKSFFGMKLLQWSNGKNIRVFVLADQHPIHISFCKNLLNAFPYQLRVAWDRLVFSGTGQSPIQVNSEDEMLVRIANTPNAIGYVSAQKLLEFEQKKAIRVNVIEIREVSHASD